MSSTQLYHHGDRVKLADDLGPSMRHFPGAGQEAYVEASYHDQFGGSGDHCYTLMMLDGSGISWYYERQLTLVKAGDLEGYQAVKLAGEERSAMESQLPWIIENWKILKAEDRMPGSSIETLAKLAGMRDMWGDSGEGLVWYTNAVNLIDALDDVMMFGDPQMVDLRLAELKARFDEYYRQKESRAVKEEG